MARRRLLLLGIDGLPARHLADFVGQGLLPNVARLIADGVFVDALPVMTAKTPQNWATIATGATPGKHGIIDLFMQEHDQVFGHSSSHDFRNGFSSRWLRPEVEFIWNAVERGGGRAVVMNYACAYPSTLERGIFVGGIGSPYKDDPFAIREASLLVSPRYLDEGASYRNRQRVLDYGAEPELNPLLLRFRIGPDGFPIATVPLALRPAAPDQNRELGIRLLGASPSSLDTIEVSFRGNHLATVGRGQWSEPIRLDFAHDGGVSRGGFRLHVAELSADGESVAVYWSQVYPTDGFSEPDDVAGELTDAFGVFHEYSGETFATPEIMLDLGRWQAEWVARSATHLMERSDADLVYTKIHLIDHFNHAFYGYTDPASPWYDERKVDYYRSVMLRAYQIVDDMVALARERLPEGSAIAVVSDHGVVPIIRGVSINNILARAGIIACTPSSDDPSGEPIVDWARTRAFGVAHSGTVYVNLTGRDPTGSVPPEAYELVQREVIDALLDFRDPTTGARPIQLALANRDALALGLSGPAAGDVIVAANPGYSVGNLDYRLRNDMEPIADCGPLEARRQAFHIWDMTADHGVGLPNQQVGGGSDLATFILAGPGIASRGRSAESIRLIDVAPTLCRYLGVDGPRGSEGAILWRILDPDTRANPTP